MSRMPAVVLLLEYSDPALLSLVIIDEIVLKFEGRNRSGQGGCAKVGGVI